VRYISNYSTGELGVQLAHAFLQAGALVTHICGAESVSLPNGPGVRYTCHRVDTVPELLRTVEQLLSKQTYEAIVHAMAVLDFEPVQVASGKVSSAAGEWTITLRPTPKVIDRIRELAPQAVLVGFKLEVGANDVQLARAARAMAQRCRADLVVANDLRTIRAGRHTALLIAPDGRIVERAQGKQAIAQAVVRFVEERLGT